MTPDERPSAHQLLLDGIELNRRSALEGKQPQPDARCARVGGISVLHFAQYEDLPPDCVGNHESGNLVVP